MSKRMRRRRQKLLRTHEGARRRTSGSERQPAAEEMAAREDAVASWDAPPHAANVQTIFVDIEVLPVNDPPLLHIPEARRNSLPAV